MAMLLPLAVHPLKADIMGHLQREDNRPIRDIDPLILLVMEVILPLVHLEVTNIPLNLREVIPQVHRHQGQEVTPQVEVHHLPNNKSLVLQLLQDLRLQLQLQILRTVDLLPTQLHQHLPRLPQTQKHHQLPQQHLLHQRLHHLRQQVLNYFMISATMYIFDIL